VCGCVCVRESVCVRAVAAPLESDPPLGGPQSLREGGRERENVCVGACVCERECVCVLQQCHLNQIRR